MKAGNENNGTDAYPVAFYKELEGEAALHERLKNGRLPIIDIAGHPFLWMSG